MNRRNIYKKRQCGSAILFMLVALVALGLITAAAIPMVRSSQQPLAKTFVQKKAKRIADSIARLVVTHLCTSARYLDLEHLEAMQRVHGKTFPIPDNMMMDELGTITVTFSTNFALALETIPSPDTPGSYADAIQVPGPFNMGAAPTQQNLTGSKKFFLSNFMITPQGDTIPSAARYLSETEGSPYTRTTTSAHSDPRNPSTTSSKINFIIEDIGGTVSGPRRPHFFAYIQSGDVLRNAYVTTEGDDFAPKRRYVVDRNRNEIFFPSTPYTAGDIVNVFPRKGGAFFAHQAPVENASDGYTPYQEGYWGMGLDKMINKRVSYDRLEPVGSVSYDSTTYEPIITITGYKMTGVANIHEIPDFENRNSKYTGSPAVPGDKMIFAPTLGSIIVHVTVTLGPKKNKPFASYTTSYKMPVRLGANYHRP